MEIVSRLFWGQSGNVHNEPMMSAFHPKATEQRTQFYVGSVPCVDGSELARAFFTFAALVGAAMCSAF
jgi:hypothetical protein